MRIFHHEFPDDEQRWAAIRAEFIRWMNEAIPLSLMPV